MGVITNYIEKAMTKAECGILESGAWYGSIPCCPGVWALGEDILGCKAGLREALEEWLLLKLRDNDTIEKIDGVGLDIVAEVDSE